MKVLITGGAGFIGHHLYTHLLAHGHDVAVFDALTYAAVASRIAPADLHWGSVNDASALRKLLRRLQPTHIAHLAAETHVCTSIKYPERFVETNVNGTLMLLEAVRDYGKCSRFLHVSTDEVYGDLEGDPFTEASPLNPSNPYSASKAAGEMLARSYHRTYGLPVVVARPCNAYGPGQYPEKLIPRTIRSAMMSQPIEVHGDGQQLREWIHVADCAAAMVMLLFRGETGEVYNVGTGYEKSVNDVVRRIISKYAPASSIQRVPERSGGDMRYLMDSAKIRGLGWAPLIDFDQGLEALVMASAMKEYAA